jgi:phosphatidylinositol glycan class B
MSAIIVFVILYRAFWGLIIATSFVPDEYYQTIEPAFNLTFGDSDLGLSKTWEWNDDYRIRSFVLLLPYLLFFQFKRLLTDHFGVFLPTIIVSRGPRLIQSLLTAYSDTLLYIIMQKISGSNYFAGLALIVHLLAWSASYCLSRTLANSTETALLIIGIYFFIKETNLGDLREDDIKIITDKNAAIQDIKNSDIAQPEMTTKPTFWKALLTPSISIALVVITVHSRPTAVLFWAPLILLKTVYHKSPLRYVFFECIPTGLFVFLSCIGFDSYCYGEITITPYNFFRINISHNYAVLYYGAKPWYWNFSNGLPVMLGLYTPFLMYSFLFTLQHTEAIVLELIAFLYIILLSSITAHQEYRFLLPCLPFLHIAVGYTFWDILTGCFDFLTKESLSPRSYTVVSYCISSISLSISYVYDTLVTTAGFTTVQGEKSQINQSKKKDKSTVKKSVTTIPCRKDECKSTIMKCFSLFTLACVIVLHFITALYLSRRHQVQLKYHF